MKYSSIGFQSLLNLLDKVMKLGGLFLISSIIGRSLGPEALGNYSYLMSALAILVTITCGGTDIIAAKNFSENYSSFKTVKNIVAIRVILLIAALPLLFYFISTKENLSYIIAISLYAVFNIINLTDAYFISKGRSHILFAISCLIVIPFLLVKLILIDYYQSIYFKFYADVAEAALLIVFFLVYIFFANKKNALSLNKELDIKTIITASAPLWLNSIFVIFYTKIDQIILGHEIGSSELGKYSASIQIASIIMIPASALMSSALPKLIAKKMASQFEYDEAIKKLTKFVIIGSVCWYLILYIFSEFFIILVFGEKFQEIGNYILLYSIATTFNCLGMIAGQWALVEKYYWFPLRRSFVGLVVSLLLNLILIPVYGVVGACIAAIVCSIVTNFLLYGLDTKGKQIFKLQILSIKEVFLPTKLNNLK